MVWSSPLKYQTQLESHQDEMTMKRKNQSHSQTLEGDAHSSLLHGDYAAAPLPFAASLVLLHVLESEIQCKYKLATGLFLWPLLQ